MRCRVGRGRGRTGRARLDEGISVGLVGTESTGSGVDQCHQSGPGVELLVGTVADGYDQVGDSSASSRRGRASDRSNPARRAAATAPGWTASAGSVPAESATPPVRARHSAAASCERAELAEHTKSTRPAGGLTAVRGPEDLRRRSEHESDVAAAFVARGGEALDQPRMSEDIEVMREQVGGQPEAGGQLAGRPVAVGEVVDDREADGLAQCRVHRGTAHLVGRRPGRHRVRGCRRDLHRRPLDHSGSIESILVE